MLPVGTGAFAGTVEMLKNAGSVDRGPKSLGAHAFNACRFLMTKDEKEGCGSV